MGRDARQALADVREQARALTGGGRDGSEAFNAALGAEFRLERDQALLGQQDPAGGSRAGEIKLSFAAAAGAQSKASDRAREKAGQRFSDAMLLAMLAQLERDIEVLEKQIEGYEKQIAAVEWLIENHKIIDPTDPEHIQLLELAGIPKDEWGTVTVEQLRERLDELSRKRDDLNQKLDERREELQDLNEKHQKILISEGRQKEEELAAVEEAYRAKIDDHAASYPDLLENETAWFKTGLALMFVQAPSYRDDIASMIEKLNLLSKKDLLMDEAISDEIKDMVRLSIFDKLYASMSKNSDKPNYETLLEKALLPKLDGRTRELLVNREGTPREILAMLEKEDPDVAKLGVASTLS